MGAWRPSRSTCFSAVIIALDLVTGASLLVWPEDLAAWSRLTRLLTIGKARARPQHGEKGKCFLHWEDVAEHAAGLVASLMAGVDGADESDLRWMADQLPRGRYHHCPNGSHLAMVDDADTYFAGLVDFLHSL